MKIRILLAFLIIVLITSCSKEGTNCDNPINCLPEETQIGKNTAGCLVNGNILIPGGQSLNSGSVLKTQYNKNENPSDNLFSIIIRDLEKNKKSVFIEIRGIKLEENKTYFLEDSDTNSYAAILTETLEAYTTSNQNSGEIFISNLDEANRIISGTFWFDCKNKDGKIINVKNGRFDVNYY